jgi:hypothetical protein
VKLRTSQKTRCVAVNTACEECVVSTVKLIFLDLFSCQHDRFDELERI